jgi:predicted nucleotidyltransferase component of viral defense system
MKDEALGLAQELPDSAQRLNLLREYLQTFALRSLHESEAFLRLSFVGGTALRLLFNLPRFSEDLEFCLDDPDGYVPVRWMEKLKRDMSLAGFDVTVRWQERETIHVAWIRVAELMSEAGLSDLKEQKLSIRLEIDTRPPAGAVSLTQVVTRFMMFTVRHHDPRSLMAGKIHALCTRRYPKGRDWYDLLWYRSQRPALEPNLVLLQNALDQTEGAGTVDARRWAHHLLERLETLEVSKLASDVRPFLERPRDADALTVENLRSVLQK